MSAAEGRRAESKVANDATTSTEASGPAGAVGRGAKVRAGAAEGGLPVRGVRATGEDVGGKVRANR
ncbi:hypothetical protein LBMAG55_06180 [Verrucomicrobiota bacterium]|nr:hypothetical protein LBMAG55_06180 [Verrucomicrobiota bacterium]